MEGDRLVKKEVLATLEVEKVILRWLFEIIPHLPPIQVDDLGEERPISDKVMIGRIGVFDNERDIPIQTNRHEFRDEAIEPGDLFLKPYRVPSLLRFGVFLVLLRGLVHVHKEKLVEPNARKERHDEIPPPL